MDEPIALLLAQMFGEDDPAGEMVEAALSTTEGKAIAELWAAAVVHRGPAGPGHIGCRLCHAVDAIVGRALGLRAAGAHAE